MKIVVYIVLLLEFFGDSLALNVLVVFHVPVQSHHFLGSALSKTLANAKHNVTFITPFSEPKLPQNVKIIELKQYIDLIKQMKNETNIFEFENVSPILGQFFFSKMSSKFAEMLFELPQIQTLLKSDQNFDVVIIDEFATDSIKIFAEYYKAPLILYSTIGPCRWVNRYVGNPEPPSYIPDMLLGMSNPMSFYERAYNTIFGLISEINYHFNSFHTQNAIVKKHFPDAPDLRDFMYNVSLVLTNSHESISQPVPTVPNMIGIGGIHISPPKELPKDLQTFIDNAKDGVIYFSMGSNLIPSHMPKHVRNAILKSLGSRKERVLWKWDEDALENKPNNVIISKWFPQQGILAHPNCKLFISHGGWLSTTESMAMGVPILAIPIVGDQKLNAARISGIGVGRTLPFSQINEANFKALLDEMLSNPKYAENAKLRSQLFHDRPMKPAELAVYWIEYIARYQGAPHLRVAGVDLPLYKYFLLDVTALILGVNIIVIFIIWKLLRFIIWKRNSRKNQKPAEKKSGKKSVEGHKAKKNSKLKYA